MLWRPGSGAKLPDLLIADISASDEPSADVEALSAWSRKVPIWIIASRTYIVEKGLRGHGFEMILLRPVDVGELVDQIKQRLEEEFGNRMQPARFEPDSRGSIRITSARN